MAQEPATLCLDEDDYYCPVCQDVFKTPVRTKVCQHVFCRKCFLTAMKEGETEERARPIRALDVENNMKKFSGNCRCCEKQIRFSRMRQHYKSCKKYQDEYGVSSIIPSFQISQDSSGNSFRSDSSTSDNGENADLQIPEEGTSAHSAFKCHLCQETNFTRERLLDHCNIRHLSEMVPVICPICISLPWAEPNEVTRDFVGHLNQRHQFDYEDFVVNKQNQYILHERYVVCAI
uniref:E3 ubiquitin-protein ligase RNF138 n=1 Tax=Sphenodon punctatus TaxID=8508 RepID=A0A8D0GMU9_SPHPU